MMTQTSRLNLPLLAPGMATKEVVHNEALELLAALVQPTVAAGPQLTSDPAAVEGDMAIVRPGATGEFAGQDNAIAVRGQAAWRFVQPFAGMRVNSRSSAMSWRFDGSQWLELSLEGQSVIIGGVQVVGGQEPDIVNPTGGGTQDSKARTAIEAILATLRSHGLIAGAQ